jgi:hypothetical protein
MNLPKNNFDVSRAENAIPSNGDCGSDVNRWSGVR